MNQKMPACIIGSLYMVRLFVGSKSEGLYPVLHADDGSQYRLHYKGDISLNEKTLSQYAGKTVQIIGNVDNLRGHLRIVLEADHLPLVMGMTPAPSSLISELTSEEVSDAGPGGGAEVSILTTFEVPPDGLQEGLASKTNESEE